MSQETLKLHVKDFLYRWTKNHGFAPPRYESGMRNVTYGGGVVHDARAYVYELAGIIGQATSTKSKDAIVLAAENLCELLVRAGYMTAAELATRHITQAKRRRRAKNEICNRDQPGDRPPSAGSKTLGAQPPRAESKTLGARPSSAEFKTLGDQPPSSESWMLGAQSIHAESTTLESVSRKRKASDAGLTKPFGGIITIDLEAEEFSMNLSPKNAKKRRTSGDTDAPNENEEVDAYDEMDKEIKRLTETIPNPFSSTSGLNRLQSLDRDIWDHYIRNRQCDNTFKGKMEALQKITECLHSSLGRPFLVIPVGSTVNGLGSYRSDMDLCLVLYDRLPNGRDVVVESSKIALDALYESRRALRHLREIRNVEMIRAKIPIVRFEYVDRVFSGLEVDINCNNLPGVRNSHLLHYYARIDERFPALSLAIKHWAIRASINDASDGTLSSYALILMVIHYLQYGLTITHRDQPPILPNLQALFPDIFHAESDVQELSLFADLPLRPSISQLGLGDLLLGFFAYYATRFDFETKAISIRSASVICQDQLEFSSSKSRLICIEEPFERTNVARAVYTRAKRKTIIRAFKEAYKNLYKKQSLQSIGMKLN